jgi:hypothetical protein
MGGGDVMLDTTRMMSMMGSTTYEPKGGDHA